MSKQLKLDTKWGNLELEEVGDGDLCIEFDWDSADGNIARTYISKAEGVSVLEFLKEWLGDV